MNLLMIILGKNSWSFLLHHPEDPTFRIYIMKCACNHSMVDMNVHKGVDIHHPLDPTKHRLKQRLCTKQGPSGPPRS